MILGTGIDIVEIDRVKKAIEKQRFVDRVYTKAEILYCESRGAQAPASYAARFAGKEAVAKAFGTGFSGGNFTDIEILPDEKGCPKVQLYNFFAAEAQRIGLSEIHISLSHARLYATAQVIFWRGIE